MPPDHPLRPIKRLADRTLGVLSKRFEGCIRRRTFPSIPPEMLLRATLLQAFFRFTRSGCGWEQMNYDLCSVSSLGCRWTRRSGTRRCSRTIVIGSWTLTWCMSS